VPNRLFEPALTVLADLDRALGAYLRGIFLECCLLGLSVLVLLVIIGIPLRWAIVIGSVAGASNVIPYMGFAMALASDWSMRFWPMKSIRCCRWSASRISPCGRRAVAFSEIAQKRRL